MSAEEQVERLVEAVAAVQVADSVAAEEPQVAPVSPPPAPVGIDGKEQKKVLHLVIDSGAIIKGTNLSALAEVRRVQAIAFLLCVCPGVMWMLADCGVYD